MATVGHNPARIIPAWKAFVDGVTAAGGRCRGVGEPIWAARSPAELEECERHEALLNVAFADAPAWRLLCPYDASDLSDDVLREAERNHPVVWDRDAVRESSVYRGLDDAAQPLHTRLDDPGDLLGEHPYGLHDLGAIRGTSRRIAEDMGFATARVADIALVASELATNSVRHGGGAGRLRIWRSSTGLVLDAIDAGSIAAPLAGREKPAGMDGGYGLWIANQVADLVQIRMTQTGSIVRAHFAR
jgi:anti-sigma regulatory factor (Ser/Thr protein kinase)